VPTKTRPSAFVLCNAASEDTEMTAKVLALDGMGVVYRTCDDVGELLIPFIRARGSSASDLEIAASYHQASLGLSGARDFWAQVGCDPALENEYLGQHELRPGLLELLAHAKKTYQQIWCISNDLSEWSGKLRARWQLEEWFHGWIISGDVGHRKPAVEIYSALTDRARVAGHEVLFVDDRRANVDAATALGWGTLHFDLDSRADGTSCAQLWTRVLQPVSSAAG